MAKLFANPYDITATGFFFESFEEFEEQSKRIWNDSWERVKEFEIEYIDGDNPKLFAAAEIDQSKLEVWFDELDHISDDSDEGLALRFLLVNVWMPLEDALRRYHEVRIYRGRLEDYAADLLDEHFDLPTIVFRYFDFEAFARDLVMGGDVAEIAPGVWCVNASEF